jgi:hypothetical protein
MILEELCKKAIEKKKLVDYLQGKGEYFSSPWDLQYDIEEVLKKYYLNSASVTQKKYIEKALTKLVNSRDEFDKRIGYSSSVALNLKSVGKLLLTDFKKKSFEKFKCIDTRIDFINALMFFNLIDQEKLLYFKDKYNKFMEQHLSEKLVGSELVLKNTFEKMFKDSGYKDNIIKNVKGSLVNLDLFKWYTIKKDGNIDPKK